MKTVSIDAETKTRESLQIRVSEHAFRRGRERLHWTRNALIRMADRALQIGFSPRDTAGPLKHFLTLKSWADRRSCPFLYGGIIYVFGLDEQESCFTLLTVYRAPNELLRALVNKPVYSTNEGEFGEN